MKVLKDLAARAKPPRPEALTLSSAETLGTKTRLIVFFKWSVDFHKTVLLVINEQRELLNVMLSPGNTDDRKSVPQLQQLFGKVFGDRGDVSQKLVVRLWQSLGIQLVTRLRRNINNCLMRLSDKPLLRRRAIVEWMIY